MRIESPDDIISRQLMPQIATPEEEQLLKQLDGTDGQERESDLWNEDELKELDRALYVI